VEFGDHKAEYGLSIEEGLTAVCILTHPDTDKNASCLVLITRNEKMFVLVRTAGRVALGKAIMLNRHATDRMNSLISGESMK
jgi:hypothetical protein